MNSTLITLKELADSAKSVGFDTRVSFEVADIEGVVVAEGYYVYTSSRERGTFSQAIGKLLAAGYEITTFKELGSDLPTK